MTVVLDTNVLPGVFKWGHRYEPIYDAWIAGRFRWAVSTEILLEYEEVLNALIGRTKASALLQLLQAYGQATGSVQRISPTYRFQAIPNDPDDNKFADCAIVAHADFVITEDRHFRPMEGSGYKPQPISPEEFIRLFLAS